MNERMLDLAIQAKDWAYADHDGYTAQMLFEQKFAELIVRECVKVTLESIYHNGIGDVNDCIIVGNDVAEHFGVEE